MTQWWQRRSLKLRLTLWFAAVTLLVVALFAFIVFEVVEHRLATEIDRQLRIDFDVAEGQLDTDAAGAVRWLVRGAHGDEGFARLSAWFEVWSEERQLLLRHWPVREGEIKHPLPAPQESGLNFRTVQLEPGLHVRLMERPARIRSRGVVIRVFRDESDMRRTLHDIVEVFLLVAPIAGVVAALGGYLLAWRSLRPMGAMAGRAQEITSESLGRRLPVPNPHDEIGQLAEVFNGTLQRLENSFAELRRFTADASHELRTPLTALRAVGEDALRERDHPAISSMLEEAQRIEELIESLLALARLDAGKAQLAREPVVVRELALEVRETLKILATEKDQTIDLVGDSAVGVPADRVLLRQTLINVLHNAIRYAPMRSRVRITWERKDGRVTIAVADEGPGIAPEHQAKIFDRFYRVDKARARADGGHGLGLAIAKAAVERHGGRIELESALGRGSVFRIQLPA